MFDYDKYHTKMRLANEIITVFYDQHKRAFDAAIEAGNEYKESYMFHKVCDFLEVDYPEDPNLKARKEHNSKFYDTIAKELERIGCEYVVYSAYKEDGSGKYINNLNEVAIEGKVRFLQYADEYWGEGRGGDFTCTIKDPTWLELCIAADDMIQKTQDFHHVFLEGVYQRKDGTYEFIMGS